jgi:hypothetical protein
MNKTSLIMFFAVIFARNKEHVNPKVKYFAINNIDISEEHPKKIVVNALLCLL